MNNKPTITLCPVIYFINEIAVLVGSLRTLFLTLTLTLCTVRACWTRL